MSKTFCVYIIANITNTVIYIGVTNDLERRMYEHKNKRVDGFTKKYNISKLLYYETYNNVKDAIAREKQLKNWHHEWKINLIKLKNLLLSEIFFEGCRNKFGMTKHYFTFDLSS